MFYIRKRIEISASHSLKLNYESKCENLHGHNWIIDIYLKGDKLNENGMLMDFSEIKKKIHSVMDHKNLNDVFDFNPTAENIAFWICHEIDLCYKVEVQESINNSATYVKED